MSIAAPAIAAFTNPGNPSGNGVAPTVVNGFPNCPSGQETHNWTGTGAGTQNLAAGGSITVTKPTSPSPGPGNASRYFNFSATGAKVNTVFAKTDVFVVGFITESNRYVYGAGQTGASSDTKLHSPTNSSKQPYALSAIRFCYTPIKYKISGTKFYDWGETGTKDAVDQGLAGWTIQAKQGATVKGSATTAANGSYTIELAAGTYDVCEVEQSGWTRSAPGGTGCYSINLTADVTGKDFGNFKLVTLSGTKFYDAGYDPNGAKDGGEVGIGGFTVTAAATGTQPAGNPHVGGSAVTAGDGSWSIVVHAGKYSICESGGPTGDYSWVQTAPTGNGGCYPGTTDYQANTGDKDFGNYKQVTLTGTVFHDNDNDGKFDVNAQTVEEGLEAWGVRLYQDDGTTTAGTTSSNGNGEYGFDVPAGEYLLCVTLPGVVDGQGWVQSPEGDNSPGGNTSCDQSPAYDDDSAGYDQDFQTDTSDLDFGSTQLYEIPAGGSAMQGNGVTEPNAVVELGNGCTTGFYPFDIGVTPDEEIEGEQITQFVLFGDAQVSSECVIHLTILWHAEDADYDGNDNLVVPPTLVRLPSGGGFGNYQAARFCSEFGGPTLVEPTCLDSQLVLQGTGQMGDFNWDIEDGKVQVFQQFTDFGDPPKARN
jgi:hypothetical protein